MVQPIDMGGDDLYVNTITTGVTKTLGGSVPSTTGGSTIAGGGTLTLTAATGVGRTVALDTAAGTTVTLPAATGTGNMYRFVVTVLATTNNHIVKVANTSDTMQGMIISTLSGTPTTNNTWLATAGTSDTITLNKTTTGSVTLGEWFEIRDIATNKFQVFGVTSQSGTGATPFSATV